MKGSEIGSLRHSLESHSIHTLAPRQILLESRVDLDLKNCI